MQVVSNQFKSLISESKRLAILIGILTSLLWSLSLQADETKATLAPNLARISVGTLNGKDIWLDEVMRATKRLPEEFQKAPLEKYYSQLIADIIDSQLAATAARAEGYQEKNEVAEAMRLAVDRVLAEVWLSNKVRSKINDESIQNAYNRYVADVASRKQVTASHILVETEDEAKAIIKLLNNGADFVTLAQEKSTGPTGPNGGALGAFSRGQMTPTFESAAFSLDPGSFSQNPVQTQFGWHVIKVDDTQITPAPELAVMRTQLINNLSTQMLARVLEELRAKQAIRLRDFKDVRKDAIAATN